MSHVVKPGAARAVADIAQGTIVATVVIEAPIERVFAALTTPEEVARWWGSDDTYRITDWESDPRLGGRWRSSGRSKNGEAFSVEGEYLELDPPYKLAQTWKYSWDGGGEATTVSYRLDAVEGGTRVTVRHEGFKGRAQACDSHRQGWERVLAWLDAYLSPL